jgi:hypothetical protein
VFRYLQGAIVVSGNVSGEAGNDLFVFQDNSSLFGILDGGPGIDMRVIGSGVFIFLMVGFP